uniref:Uncharacterized protein n=1 Tax=Trichuris muris TaxID=70415 RepID=A0A5S6QQW5_TRIMR
MLGQKVSTEDGDLSMALFRMSCETGAAMPPVCAYTQILLKSRYAGSGGDDDRSGGSILRMIVYLRIELKRLNQNLSSPEEITLIDAKSQKELQCLRKIYALLSSKYERVSRRWLSGCYLVETDYRSLSAYCVLLFLSHVHLFYVKRNLETFAQTVSCCNVSSDMWDVICTLLPAPLLDVGEQTQGLINLLRSELRWMESTIPAFWEKMSNDWRNSVEKLLKHVPLFHSILNTFQCRFDNGLRSRQEHLSLGYVASVFVNMTLVGRRAVAVVCLQNNEPEVQAAKVAKVCRHWRRRLLTRCWELGVSVGNVELCRLAALRGVNESIVNDDLHPQPGGSDVDVSFPLSGAQKSDLELYEAVLADISARPVQVEESCLAFEESVDSSLVLPSLENENYLNRTICIEDAMNAELAEHVNSSIIGSWNQEIVSVNCYKGLEKWSSKGIASGRSGLLIASLC